MGIGEAQQVWERYVGMSHPLEWATNGQPDEAQIERHVAWAEAQGYFSEGAMEEGELAEAMRTCIRYDLEAEAQSK